VTEIDRNYFVKFCKQLIKFHKNKFIRFLVVSCVLTDVRMAGF
jgi:hypothetical protein